MERETSKKQYLLPAAPPQPPQRAPTNLTLVPAQQGCQVILTVLVQMNRNVFLQPYIVGFFFFFKYGLKSSFLTWHLRWACWLALSRTPYPCICPGWSLPQKAELFPNWVCLKTQLTSFVLDLFQISKVKALYSTESLSFQLSGGPCSLWVVVSS